MEPARAVVASNSRRATTALVLGVVGAVCCQLVSPVAWILGARELKAIRQGHSGAAGRGFALAGMILGIVGTGLLLISLLILPAILVPNFIDALQKAKQKRTMADLRTLGVALDAYCAARPEATSCYPEVETVEDLIASLSPAYLSAASATDGWKRPMHYSCWADPGFSGCQHAALRSAGRDGVLEVDDPTAYEPGAFLATEYDHDLVWVDGLFARYPNWAAPN